MDDRNRWQDRESRKPMLLVLLDDDLGLAYELFSWPSYLCITEGDESYSCLLKGHTRRNVNSLIQDLSLYHQGYFLEQKLFHHMTQPPLIITIINFLIVVCSFYVWEYSRDVQKCLAQSLWVCVCMCMCLKLRSNVSWTGFDPGFERPVCLATLKSSDRTKQSVWDDNIIYIYIYIYI